MQKVEGSIHISYSVNCPECDEYLDDYYERDWFNKTMGSDFPVDGYDGEYEAVCPKCKAEFIVNGFVH